MNYKLVCGVCFGVICICIRLCLVVLYVLLFLGDIFLLLFFVKSGLKGIEKIFLVNLKE